ncbi:MAG: family 16 glycoside hydrolase [Caldilineaceae bacterium]
MIIKKSVLLTFIVLVSGLIGFTSKLIWAQTANSILFSDTFWDGNMTGWTTVDANGATDGPSNWSVILDGSNYTLRQNSNIYLLPQREGTYAYTGDDSWTDYHLAVDVLPNDNDSFFVMFRYVNDDNYYRFISNEQNKFRRLEKKIEGTFTTIAEDTAAGYTQGTWQNVHISIIGTQIQIRFNYELLFSITDTSLSGGKIAVGTEGSINCRFDNILVSNTSLDPYADAVVDSHIKQTNNSQTDVRFALGRPRGADDDLSIGGPDYWIVFDMGENEAIIDGEGNDLRVIEIGALFGNAVDEEHDVYASNSPTGTWSYLGQGIAISEFDLRDAGLEKARYIRIEDLSTRTDNSPTPGSDIDGLQALNMENYSLILPPQSVDISVTGVNILLDWDPIADAVNYNIYASRSSGLSNLIKVNDSPVSTNTYNGPQKLDHMLRY